MRRRLLLFVPLIAMLIAALVAGCGGKYQLPTEHPAAKVVPSDKSYAMIQTWVGMDGIQDLLLTQRHSQLFILFNVGGTGGPDVPRGWLKLYPPVNNNPVPVPIKSSYFPDPRTLFNPVAFCAWQDEVSDGLSKLFVLDEGDSCMATFDDSLGNCKPDPRPDHVGFVPRRHEIRDYRSTWRVREFWMNNKDMQGDTASTFTDTTFKQVYGIAADQQGRVYVSGIAAVLDSSKINNSREWQSTFRIFRYERGIKPGYGGLVPEELNWDANMPGAGARWHRDTTWFVGRGTGAGFVIDPRGMAWSSAGSPALFVADRGNMRAKTISPYSSSTGYIQFDGSDSPMPFMSPEAVATDIMGFLYVVDRGTKQVVRYDPFGGYKQTVNVELNSFSQALADPVGVAVDTSVAYVGDRGRGQVIRYARRP